MNILKSFSKLRRSRGNEAQTDQSLLTPAAAKVGVACSLGLTLLLGALPVVAADKTNSPLLTVKRIFDSEEFGGDKFSARE